MWTLVYVGFTLRLFLLGPRSLRHSATLPTGSPTGLYRAAKSSRNEASQLVASQSASMTRYCSDKEHHWTQGVLWCDKQVYKCDVAFKGLTYFSADRIKISPTKKIP